VKRQWFNIAIGAAVTVLLVSGTALAKSSFQGDFNAKYRTAGTRLDDCNVCHVNYPATKDRNSYGVDWKNAGESFAAVEGTDSDGDGYTNIEEIRELSFPGDPNDVPSPPPPSCTDWDGDGYNVEGSGCGAVDCDDADAGIHPGATEYCNDGVDNDCDLLVDAEDPDAIGCQPSCSDGDGDGFAIEGAECGPIDCDDADASVNPNALEDCTDEVDNDCDQLVDSMDPDATDCPPDCIDTDGDGYASNGGVCGPIDCDDDDASVHPGAIDTCGNGIDEDCSGNDAACPPPECPDDDGDGYLDDSCGGTDCNDFDASINPGGFDLCLDGVDQDCNGKDRTKGKGCPKLPREGAEGKGKTCADGLDNDGDGLMDCQDDGCWNHRSCR
jgi:hypothetical protein